MDYATAALVCVVGLIVLMMLGVPVAFTIGFVSVAAGILAFGDAFLAKVGWITFHQLYSLAWTPLPLFVLLACVLNETRIGEDLYKCLRNWSSRVPGGLIATSIIGEAVMGAMVGTSEACILALGKVAAPEFERYGYNKGLSMGGLLAGGVLGPLIPPSTGMIVYAILSGVSLGSLFMAGYIPGIILAVMLLAVPLIACWRNPRLGPPAGKVSWADRFSSIKFIWPIVLVILSIMGAIYFGVATPTEAAGVGCTVVIILSVTLLGLRWDGLKRAMIEAVSINAMIMFIVVGAMLFSYVIGSSNLAKGLTSAIMTSNISPWLVIVGINIILLFLGCLIDGATIMLLTVPIFVPLIVDLGFDPVWFGVIFVVNMQIALITPPMGLDLYIVQNVFGIPTGELLRGVMPYMIVLIIFLGIIIAFPQLSLWLPSTMNG